MQLLGNSAEKYSAITMHMYTENTARKTTLMQNIADLLLALAPNELLILPQCCNQTTYVHLAVFSLQKLASVDQVVYLLCLEFWP